MSAPATPRPVSAMPDDVLQRNKWFANLPVHVQGLLVARAQTIALRDGENIFLRGQPYDGVYCVLSGLVRIQSSTPSGHSGVLVVVEPSQWFGELGMFDRLTRSHDAQAAEDSTLLHLPVGTLDQILQVHPEVSHHFGALLSQKMRSIFVGLEAFALLPARAWVARRLLMMATQHWTLDKPTPKNTIPVSQEELAQMLALTRQTVGKVLQQLEAEGMVRAGYGHVEILDWNALWLTAEMSPPKSLA